MQSDKEHPYSVRFLRPGETAHLPRLDQPEFGVEGKKTEGQWLFYHFLRRHKELGGDVEAINRPLRDVETQEEVAPAVESNPVVADPLAWENDHNIVRAIKCRASVSTMQARICLDVAIAMRKDEGTILHLNYQLMAYDYDVAPSTVIHGLKSATKAGIFNLIKKGDSVDAYGLGPWILDGSLVAAQRDKALEREAWLNSPQPQLEPELQPVVEAQPQPQRQDSVSEPSPVARFTFNPSDGLNEFMPGYHLQVGTFVVDRNVVSTSSWRDALPVLVEWNDGKFDIDSTFVGVKQSKIGLVVGYQPSTRQVVVQGVDGSTTEHVVGSLAPVTFVGDGFDVYLDDLWHTSLQPLVDWLSLQRKLPLPAHAC